MQCGGYGREESSRCFKTKYMYGIRHRYVAHNLISYRHPCADCRHGLQS
jgi:hypothetical protein